MVPTRMVVGAHVVVATVLVACAVARAQSALDGFNPGADSTVIALAMQSDGRILVGGAFTMLGGGGTGTTPRNKIGRLNADGSLDPTFDPGADSGVFALAVQADGKVLVGGNFTMLGGGGFGTTPRNRIGRLHADGSLDTTFDPGADGIVSCMAVQPDGKIVVGGDFTMLGGGGTGTTPRSHVARLNPDGSLDTSFDPGANDLVRAVAVQPDGRILVAGDFTTLGGGAFGTVPRNRIGRLDPDGTVDTSFDPGANASVFGLALQPDGKILLGGAFWTLGGGGTGLNPRNKIGRLNADGSVDPTFAPGASGNAIHTMAVQPDGKILVGGFFSGLGGGTGTTPRSSLGRLNADGSLDAGFNPGADDFVFALVVQPDASILVGGAFSALGGGSGNTPRSNIGRIYADGSLDDDLDTGANDSISAVAVQPDGKVLVGGSFTTLAGRGSGTTSRQHLARLNADGTIDPAFDPGANGGVWAVAVQPDGKILVGGAFTTLGGGGTGTTPRHHVARLNADGTVDTSFDPGANGSVRAFAVQPDGQIVVGGDFTTLGGGGTGTTPRQHLGRLNANGSLDTSFDPGADGLVFAVALQPDGRILVGGLFTTLGGGGGGSVARHYLGRLHADGSLDLSFDPGANSLVFALAPQADAKILVGGYFTRLGGGGTGTTPRQHLGRLNPDGSLDASFNPGASGAVRAFAVQADGRILVGGDFSTLGGAGGTGTTARSRIGRLHPDGSVDPSFDPGANSQVFALSLQPDGKVLVAGSFTMLGGGGTGTTSRNRIGRLATADAATQRLVVTGAGSVVTWTRTGTGPELSRVWFESSTDAITYYASLGSVTRIEGGWQVSGQGLPVNQDLYVRARGYYATSGNDSASLIESTRNTYVSCPIISPTSLADGVVGVAYATTFTTSGAIGVVTFAYAGALPTGITLVEGTLSGTPTQHGRFPISVGATDASSGCTVSLNVALTIGAGPTVTGVSPGAGPTTGGTRVTVEGTGFLAGQTTVTIGGVVAAGVSVTSATSLTATTPAGPAGAVDVAVVTPGGTASLADGFRYHAAPTVTSVVPDAGPIAGGTRVTLTGTGFVASQTTVAVGGAPATSVMVTSATTLTAATPEGVAGPADVVVTTPGGSASLADGFTYVATYTRYLAEGATSEFFDMRLALLNPGDTGTTAALSFLQAGKEPITTAVPVPARTRVTVDPKTIPGLAVAEFSTTIESAQPLVVDRTMSWATAEPYGAHAETSVGSPAQTWYVAEGATHSGFNLFYLLQNPGATEALVRVRYLRPTGGPLEKTYRLPPTSRTNIWVNLEDFAGLGPALAATDVSAVFEVLNGQPIVVERAMYADVPGQTFGAGHESAGLTTPALEWFLAEGATGGYFDLFVLIANPSAADAEIEATYLLPDGTTLVKPYVVAADSRFNIWVDYEDARLADTAVSTTIRSTNGVPIIVERSMWWPQGGWFEAHNSPGATTTGTKWALAEGEVDATRNLETYVLIANTSATHGALIGVTLLFEDGTSVAGWVGWCLPNSRFTVPVGANVTEARGRRFGVIVESLDALYAPGPQIVVERAMYWDAAGQVWAAGTNALATKLQ